MVGFDGVIVRVLVNGRASFKNSASLREFSREMMSRGLTDFVVDLSHCAAMDSTFMGTLAGIGLKLREGGRGKVVICGAGERNESLLRNLGLDHLLEIRSRSEAACCEEEQPLDSSGTSVGEKARAMLEAHEALAVVSPENLSKFKDVIEFLRQDLEPATPR